MASSPQYTYPQPPPPAPHQRLPSIKELHFDKMEHARPARPEWARPSPPNLPPQHQMSMPPPHESPKTQYPHSPAPPKMAEQYASSNMPPPQQTGHSSMGPGPSRGEASSQNSSKRPRSGSDASVGVSPGRSHASYAPQHAYPSQHPSPSFQAGPPVPVPPPHDSVHPPAPFTHPPPPYAYPHPHMVQRHYAVPSQVPQHMPPPNTYPPPVTPHEHWQHHPPPPPPPPPYATFSRPSGMAPPNMDPRAAMPPPPNTVDVNARQRLLAEIHEHCRVLQDFAHHYATLQASQPNIQPSPQEMQDMSWRANIVNRLIEDLRRTQDGGGSRDSVAAPSNATSATDETPRPPKRPWEDMSRDEAPASNGNYPEQPQSQYLDVADKTTAEADMEIIRSKRATSTGGNAPGQPKSKYRKRSRATPPGKCHSCNIRETPEWRRGPDGARTLCNACGLHYAKLMRKREKGADGKTIPIDLQTLRASTQSARGTDPEQSHPAPVQQHHPHPNPNVVPYEQPKQQQQQQQHQQQQQQPPPAHANHHPGHPSPHPHPHGAPYQLMPVNSGPSHPNSQAHQMMPPPPPPVPAQQTHGETGLSVPPPPWMTSSSSSSSGRSVYQSDHQSYMRTSHPPSHARASPQ